MATLPPGWEWDYDGNRWLYRYTPTGHVQYHFPNAGDEFPDFIDAASPAPDLAPEEKLESQQQVKRHTSVNGGPSRTARTAAEEEEDGWKSRMSATAQPVSAVWEDDFGAEDDNETEGEAVFQPENFMYLGPGTYVDVSPLVEEEEEAARRAVVGAELRGGPPTDNNRGVSPMVSQNTTPMVRTSETVARTENEAQSRASTTAMNDRAVEPPPPPPTIAYEEPAMVTPIGGFITGDDIVGEASAVPDEEALNYEMYELPVETAVPMHLQFDPVGVVAEMPTEHTASARVETHPDPVELAGNYVMAPVEIEPRPGFVELPAEIDPSEEGIAREERLTDQQRLELRRQEVRQHQEERQRYVQQRKEERKKLEAEELLLEIEADELQKELDMLQQQQQQLQQQNEGHSPSQEQNNGATGPFRIARKPTLRESSTIYNAYAGRSQGQGQEDYQAYAPGQAPQTSAQPLPARIMSPALQREASLNMSMRPAAASKAPVDSRPGVVKYPSVLRPARGKPGQSPERKDALKGSEQGSGASSSTEAAGKEARLSGYNLIQHGQHPPSMTPTPAPVPVPAPAPAAVQQNPPQQPPIATAQPPAPIQRPFTTAPNMPQSNVQIAQQYAVPPIPPKVAAQLPYPTGSVRMPQPPLIRQSTAPYPQDDGPPVIAPYGPLQSRQPMRPASAMPVLQNQRRGPAPGQPQQMPIRTGPPPPGAVIVPAGMAPRSAIAGPAQQLPQQRRQSFQPVQNAAPVQSQQPTRPQSVVNPGVYANFASYQTPPPQQRPIQRRPTQEDVSPIRSRSQSMSSGAAPLDTPSPIDSRRSSTNSIAPQNINNSYFASVSGSQGSASVPPSSVPLARPPPDLPQSPVAQGGGRQSAPPQQLANVNQGNMQGMLPPQPQSQMQQPNPENVSGGVQRSQSLRQVRTNTGPTPDTSGQNLPPQSPTRIGPTASGHLLTSIEEHDEAQHAAAAMAPLKVNQRKVLTKAPPNPTPGPQQVPVPAPLQTQAQIPQQTTAVQIQGVPPQQVMGPPGQSPAPVMPMQGFQPVGPPMQQPPQQYQMQQPLQQQQWTAQPLPNMPLAAQPGSLPPLQTPQQTSPTAGNKENRKSWGKWFKSSGSKSAVQSPVGQQPQHTFPPVPIPQAMPGPNQPFQMQPVGQQFPVSFQGGQPMGQQPLQFQQPMPHPETVHQQFRPAPLNANTNSPAGGEQFPNGMTPAPLFSGASSSKRPVASPTEAAQQGTQNRWAGKSPVDYSGGGWGDEDDEFS